MTLPFGVVIFLVSWFFGWLVGWLVCQSVSQSISQLNPAYFETVQFQMNSEGSSSNRVSLPAWVDWLSNCQLLNNHSTLWRCFFGWLVGWLVCQSVSQSVSQLNPAYFETVQFQMNSEGSSSNRVSLPAWRQCRLKAISSSSSSSSTTLPYPPYQTLARCPPSSSVPSAHDRH